MLDLLPFVFLFVVVLFASAVSTVAGAGSLLVLPALIFSGLDASSANATNRVGILVQTAAALITYRRAGLRVGARELRVTVAAMLGGGVGSLFATTLTSDQLRIAILIAMVVMLALSLLPKQKSKAPTDAGGTPALPEPTPGMLLGFFVIGVYGGFLQAGVSVLAMLFLIHVYSVEPIVTNVVKAAAAFGLTIVALSVFAARGEHIDAPRGLVVVAASMLGGLVGARIAMRVSERVLRASIVVAVLLSLIKLVGDSLM